MPSLAPLRFGAFEFDLRSGELRRSGVKVRLADQPRQVLELLLERPAEPRYARPAPRTQRLRLRSSSSCSMDRSRHTTSLPKAEAAARKAIELNDTLPQPHRTLGAILRTYYWKWDEGDREFRRARELSGKAIDVYGSGFQGLIRARRLDEALTEAERARELDPRSFNAHINVAVARRAAGQFDRTVAELRRALEMHPGRSRARFQLGVTLVLMGRPTDAIPELERAANASPEGNPRFQAYVAYAYAAAGRPLDARRILQALEAQRRNQYVSSFGLALVYDALGEKAAALAAFERAYQERAVEIAQSEQYPRFTTIASEPQFLERMRSIGLRR